MRRAREAERLGYRHAMHAARELEGPAEDIGRHLAAMAREMRSGSGPDCLITGGEPVVRLADAALRGKGGRNQQLALAALIELLAGNAADGRTSSLDGVALLSGGTDGEDGPTDAAGALVDAEVARANGRTGPRSARFLGEKRRLHVFRTQRRPDQNRPDAHERVRRAGGARRSRSSNSGTGTEAVPSTAPGNASRRRRPLRSRSTGAPGQSQAPPSKP